MKFRSEENRSAGPVEETDLVRRRREAQERIRRLHSRSHRGLWGLALFLLISILALQDFSFLPALPPGTRRLLGAAPPTNLISIALVVYSFSALILTLARMWSGTGAYRGWSHLAYLGAFYGFYGYGGVLDDNFLAVFAAGLTILGLESYHVWTWCAEEMDKEKETLARLDRSR